MSHPTDGTCIFCKIVAGQIPCYKLVEDADTIAFSPPLVVSEEEIEKMVGRARAAVDEVAADLRAA